MKNKVLKILGRTTAPLYHTLHHTDHDFRMMRHRPTPKTLFFEEKKRHDPPFCSAFVTHLLQWSVDRMRRRIVCESWLVQQCRCTVQSWQRSLQRWKGNILCIMYYVSSF